MTQADQIVYTDEKRPNLGDDQLNVTFYDRDIDGEMKEFVRIQVPGDTSLVIDEYATDYYRARFSKRYELYKSLATDSGTDISILGMSESMESEFKRQGFRFIEQLATAPDSAFAHLMGGFSWRLKAKNYLKENAPKTEKELSYENEINNLKSQVSELMTFLKSGRKNKSDS